MCGGLRWILSTKVTKAIYLEKLITKLFAIFIEFSVTLQSNLRYRDKGYLAEICKF